MSRQAMEQAYDMAMGDALYGPTQRYVSRQRLEAMLEHEVSRFEAHFQLAEYLAGYTDRLIGMAVGLPSVRQIADEHYYADLPGGVLEAAGRLFKRSVKLYVYPTRDAGSGQIHSVEGAAIPAPWHHLRDLLLAIGRIEPIRHYDEEYLSIRTPDVLARIEVGDESWEAMVPAVVAATIKTKRLFGYQASAMGTGRQGRTHDITA